MRLNKQFTILLLFSLMNLSLFAQDKKKVDIGRLTGSLEANANFFQRDSAIGAATIPQYENLLYGAESWMQLNYSNNAWGLEAGLRFDIYNNSNLIDPNNASSGQGIGRWYIKKKLKKLSISGGYLYDQIGSGIIFRAWESRPLAVDNSLYGIRLDYSITDDWKVKLFSGKQRNIDAFVNSDQTGPPLFDAVVRGLSIDGFVSGGEGKNWSIAPGAGVVAKTMADDDVNIVVDAVKFYPNEALIEPQYNSYATSVYNTLSAGKFSWYVEGAYKTKDIINDPNVGFLTNNTGTVAYTSLTYATKGLGIVLDAKRTDNFAFRTNPFTVQRGAINFLPPMTRINTYRLTSRYNAATQELGEQAFQLDISYAPTKKTGVAVNFSNITDLEDELLYREVYTEGYFKYKRKWILKGGVQYQEYNQAVYELKDVPLLTAVTPYVDFLYKFSRRKSLRLEGQYMSTKQDFGSWVFGLAEINYGKHWSFVISDMYNVSPTKKSDFKKNHYPRFDVFYKLNSNRFSLSYVKQVEGVVCTGGICRLEPAFSGVKFTVNSSF